MTTPSDVVLDCLKIVLVWHVVLREGTVNALKNTLGKKKLHIHEREVLIEAEISPEQHAFHRVKWLSPRTGGISRHWRHNTFRRAIAFAVSPLNIHVVKPRFLVHCPLDRNHAISDTASYLRREDGQIVMANPVWLFQWILKQLPNSKTTSEDVWHVELGAVKQGWRFLMAQELCSC